MPRALWCLTFQDNLRDGVFLAVGERQRDIGRSQLRGKLGGLALELDGGASPGQANDFDVMPGDAVAPTGADCFHCGFFCGEAGGIALVSIGLGIAITALAFGEDAVQEAVPESLDGFGDAGDFSDIDSGSYDHEG
jgi:hypothetical protein